MKQNLSPETREVVHELAMTAWQAAANAYRMYPDNKHTFADYWNRSGDALIDRIASLLTPSVEGNTIENAREWYKRSVSNGDVGVYPMSGFMTEEVLLSMLTGYAQSLRLGGGWVQTKPDFTEPCKLLTATWVGTDWGINAWEVMWVGEHDNTYLGLCDYDGEEWGDIADLKADWYMILQSPPDAAMIKSALIKTQ